MRHIGEKWNVVKEDWVHTTQEEEDCGLLLILFAKFLHIRKGEENKFYFNLIKIQFVFFMF